jgi:hypothetical protein
MQPPILGVDNMEPAAAVATLRRAMEGQAMLASQRAALEEALKVEEGGGEFVCVCVCGGGGGGGGGGGWVGGGGGLKRSECTAWRVMAVPMLCPYLTVPSSHFLCRSARPVTTCFQSCSPSRVVTQSLCFARSLPSMMTW